MDNLNGMHHQGGGAAAGAVGGGCHAPPTSTPGSNLQDHAAVTVTVGGPMLHRNSYVGSAITNHGMPPNVNANSATSNHHQQINLNASAIVTNADCCSNMMSCSFEETKELLARHLRRCCDTNVNVSGSHAHESNTSSSAVSISNAAEPDTAPYPQHEANFEGLDLGGDDQTPVPLGDLLEKLQAESDLDDGISGPSSGQDKSGEDAINDLIRLHSVTTDQSEQPTISATVNVATLDLSDPESIHQHLSQLNDAVLRVTNANGGEDFFNTTDNTNIDTSANSSNSNNVEGNHHLQSSSNSTISISIPCTSSSSSSSASAAANSSMAAPSSIISPAGGVVVAEQQKESSSNVHQQNNASVVHSITANSASSSSSISHSSASPLVSPSHTAIPSSPSLQLTQQQQQQKTTKATNTTTSSSSPATPRKSGSSSGSKASPQSCSVCSKVFSNASALAKHRLTHSEERRYHCNICGKAFKRQDHLNGHLLTHRSTKPFACHVEGCGKSYCDARSLRRHKENHHGQAKVDAKAANAEGQGGTAAATSAGNDANDKSNANGGQVISKSVLGDTKIKFSSKGLTAQQLQLIEQLFKQTKANKNESDAEGSSNNNKSNQGSANSSAATTTPTATAGNSTAPNAIPGPLNATTVKKNDKPAPTLPDKPVECTICSRKFKNIPALNGHMRLHGGYYKKDADGRRLVGMANTSPLKAMMTTTTGSAAKTHQGTGAVANAGGKLTNVVQPSKDTHGSLKRKACDPPGSGMMADQTHMAAKKGMNPTISVTYCQPQVTSLPSFAFSSLPQPDTSKLLANLEQKTKQMMTSPATTTNPQSTAAASISASSSSSSTSGQSTSCTNHHHSSAGMTSMTSSLRALRKQPSTAATAFNFLGGGRKDQPQGCSMQQQQQTTCGAPIIVGNQQQHQHLHHHHHQQSQQQQQQALSLPIVALPTKPLPVPMTSTLTNEICGNGAGNNKQSSVMGQGCVNNGTSIQITALIQSNPNAGGENLFGSNGLVTSSSSDFMVQASTSSQDCSLMNGIPLMNNMLSCMHAHQGPPHQHHLMASPSYGHHGHHLHHHHHHNHGNSFSSNKAASCSNLLKVDESSDKTPKVGPNHQAEIPPLLTDVTATASKSSCSSERGLLNDVGAGGGSGNLPIWQPETANSLSELEFNQYLVVASSCAVGGGSHNEEVALELLQKHGGNVQYALQDLLSTYEYIEEDAMSLFSSPEEASDSEDELLTSSCPPMGISSSSSSKSVAGNGIKQPWQPYEVDLFYEGLVRYHKNFTKIATHVGTKNVKDCVEFYYLWKNICHEESQSFKSLFAQNESGIGGQSNAAMIDERGSNAPLSEDVTSTSISSSSTTSLTSIPTTSTTANSSLTKTSPTINASLSSNEVMQSGPSSVSSVV